MNVGLQLGPTRKPIAFGNIELSIGERRSAARLEQILGLILQMPEIGTIGKRTRRVLGMGRHSNLLSSKRPSSAHRAERRFAKVDYKKVGFCPFRGPDASLTLAESYHRPVNTRPPAATFGLNRRESEFSSPHSLRTL